MHDETITPDGPGAVPVAYRDFGGTGAPVVLLHGLGGTVADWNRFASRLRDRGGHRVVAVDLRGHGRTGDGPWTWGAVLDDVEAVAAHLGLGEPSVIGMSLGGWLATMWGLRHPACPAVVNLDGHRSALTRPEHYLGMDPERRDAELARLRGLFLAPQDGPYDEAAVGALRDRHVAAAVGSGGDAAQARESFDRQLTVRDGATYVRPEWPLLEQVRAAMDATDMFAGFERLRCPFLLVVGTEPMPAQEAFAELTAAWRRGLDAALDRLTARRPDLRVERIKASHAMLVERPDDLADLALTMLPDLSRGGVSLSGYVFEDGVRRTFPHTLKATATRVGSPHAQHLEGRHFLRPGHHPGEAVLGDRAAGRHVPPGAPGRRRPYPLPPRVHHRRRGSAVLRHREGVRAGQRRGGRAHRRRLRRPATVHQPHGGGAAVRAGGPGRPDLFQQELLSRTGVGRNQAVRAAA